MRALQAVLKHSLPCAMHGKIKWTWTLPGKPHTTRCQLWLKFSECPLVIAHRRTRFIGQKSSRTYCSLIAGFAQFRADSLECCSPRYLQRDHETSFQRTRRYLDKALGTWQISCARSS